jgi:hypothetical protein
MTDQSKQAEDQMIASVAEARKHLYSAEVTAAKEQLNANERERAAFISFMLETERKLRDGHQAALNNLDADQKEGIAVLDIADAACNDMINVANDAYTERLDALRAFYSADKYQLAEPPVTMDFLTPDPSRTIQDMLTGNGDAGADVETVVNEDGSIHTRIRRPAREDAASGFQRLADEIAEVMEDEPMTNSDVAEKLASHMIAEKRGEWELTQKQGSADPDRAFDIVKDEPDPDYSDSPCDFSEGASWTGDGVQGLTIQNTVDISFDPSVSVMRPQGIEAVDFSDDTDEIEDET